MAIRSMVKLASEPVKVLLTCDHAGNLRHEALDSSDGHAVRFVLDSGYYVLNLPAEKKNGLYEFSQVNSLITYHS